jgi:hypothetical protein
MFRFNGGFARSSVGYQFPPHTDIANRITSISFSFSPLFLEYGPSSFYTSTCSNPGEVRTFSRTYFDQIQKKWYIPFHLYEPVVRANLQFDDVLPA